VRRDDGSFGLDESIGVKERHVMMTNQISYGDGGRSRNSCMTVDQDSCLAFSSFFCKEIEKK
jgi:hypothetical protein